MTGYSTSTLVTNGGNGGASAVYGSDAVAGVVNVHTRRDQDDFLETSTLGVLMREDWTPNMRTLASARKPSACMTSLPPLGATRAPSFRVSVSSPVRPMVARVEE